MIASVRAVALLVLVGCSSETEPPRREAATRSAAPAPAPATAAEPESNRHPDAAPADASPAPRDARPADPVPPENREQGTPPDSSSAEEGARRLLDAIRADDPALARDFFFPADAFDLVKDIPVPARYHRRLLAWYDEDVHTEHERYADVTNVVFDRFEMGRCSWMGVGTEGNALSYWSCRHNRLFAKVGERARPFEIRVLINWGPRWYVTHLGPIRH